MTVSEFKRSLSGKNPPAELPPALAALWWAGNDRWDRAHDIVMSEDGVDCAWVHAYLHRVEGDLDNAGYWYRRAGRKVPKTNLAEEWTTIAAALLESKPF